MIQDQLPIAGPAGRLPGPDRLLKPEAPAPAVAGKHFPATNWSVVISAAEGSTPKALLALDRLARIYWRPLYGFVRRKGLSHDDASDSVQGFFSHLLSRDFLRHVQPESGRFRTFLLSCFTHWLRDQWDRYQAVKRGSGSRPVSIEVLGALPDSISDTDESPEDAYDRGWAREVLAMALKRLEAGWPGRREVFYSLRSCLDAGGNPGNGYSEIGRGLGMTEGAVKKAVFDLRRELGRLVRKEVRRTVGSDAEVQAEVRYLVHLLRH